MRILNSFLTGLLTAPLAALVVRAAGAQCADTASARTAIAAAIGISCAAIAWISGPASNARKTLGGALLVAGGLAALFFSGSIPVPVAVIVLIGTPTIGLSLLGGGLPLLPAALLGTCIGLLATNAYLAPRMGLAIPTVTCSALLVWLRWQSATPASNPDQTPRLRFLDLALAGFTVAGAFELFRPIAMQHLSGFGWSHTAITCVLLTGAGLGSLFGGAIRGSLILRLLAPAVFLGAAWITLRSLAAASDVRTLLVNEDTLTLKDRLLAFAEPHPRLLELVRAQLLLATAALAGGFWLRVATTGGRASQSGALLFLSMALGADLAHRVFEDDALTEKVLRAPTSTYARRGRLENTEESLFTPSGVLRQVRDNSVAEGLPFLMWHGRRASRTPMFRLLEEEELHLAGRVSGGGSLLVYGLMTANHRRAFEGTPFRSYTLASELPSLSTANDNSETTTTIRTGEDGRFDVAVVLSTPFLSSESAGRVTADRLRVLRDRLKEDGTLLVWIDLRATEPQVLSAITNATLAVFGQARAWIALDGGVGPFVAIEAGPMRDTAESAFSVPMPIEALTRDGTRIHSIRDPVADSQRPRSGAYLPLADGRDLRALLGEIGSRGGSEDLCHVLTALAVHSEQYFPIATPNNPMERHRVTDDECAAILRAIHAAPTRAMILNQANQFIVLAAGTKSYERLDRVLQTLLLYHPDDPRLLYASGRSAFDLLDYESAVEDLEMSLRESRENIEAYRLLGLAYAYLDPPDYPSAISSLHAALELMPEDLETIRTLGIVLYDADRKLEAIQYLERAAMSDTTDDEVVGRLRNLRGGQ